MKRCKTFAAAAGTVLLALLVSVPALAADCAPCARWCPQGSQTAQNAAIEAEAKRLQAEAEAREAAYAQAVRAYQKQIDRQETAYLQAVRDYQQQIAEREQAYLDAVKCYQRCCG